MSVLSGIDPETLKPIDIKAFRNAVRDIHFDVYLKLSESNIAHIFSRATGIDYKRLAHYIQMGVTHLYIRPEDEAAYAEFIARPAAQIFSDPGSPPEKKIAALLNMTEQSMAELFTQIHVPEETAATAQAVVCGYVDLMTNTPQSLALLLKLVSHGEYLYYHSIAVSIFSIIMARASGQFDTKMIERIGMGGFLHDIGITQLALEDLCSADELTPEQWAEMKEHSKLGRQMLEGNPLIPDEVKYMVYQHHEEPSGHGYPNALHAKAIYYPAKVIAVADAFSALISNRPFRPAYRVDEAIAMLESKVGKHDRGILELLRAVFLRPTESQVA